MQAIKILVLGGCHTVGFPIGEQKGFISELIKNKHPKQELEVMIFEHFLFKDYKDLNNILENYKPTLLIIQCGNYEFTPNYHKYFQKVFLLKKLNIKNKDKNNPSIHYIIRNNKKQYLRKGKEYYTKKINNHSLFSIISRTIIGSIMNFRLWKKQEIRLNLNLFISTIANNKVPKVVILSSLPTLDYAINKYRMKANHFLFTGCIKYNFIYIDCFKELKFTKLHFFDKFHLNSEGHKLLANTLEKYIH